MKKYSKFLAGKFENDYIKYLVIFMIGMIAIVFLKIIWYSALMIHDDMMNYCMARNGSTYTSAVETAKTQGRFMFFIITYLSQIPFMASNLIVYKIISYASITFSVAALGTLVYRHIDKTLAFLAVLLFFGFAQADGQHNLFVAYVLTHQIPIGILLLSIERQLEYYKTKRIRDLVISAILLTISSMIYEAFILFALLSFILCVIEHIRTKDIIIKKIIKDLRFHIIFMSIYLLLYLIWRALYPSSYVGNTFKFTSIRDSIITVLTYSFGLFPSRNFFRIWKSIDISKFINYMVLIKALLVSLCFFLVITRVKKISFKKLSVILGVGILGMFIPNVLLSLTARHIMWVKAGTTAYVSSFYSYFFIIIVLSSLISFLYTSIKYKKTMVLISVCVLFFGSLATDISNQYYADISKDNLNKLEAFNSAVQSDYFMNIEDRAVIYMPEFIGIHLSMNNINWFTDIYTDKTYQFTNNKNELTFNEPTYAIKYDQGSDSIWMAQINKEFETSEIVIVSNEGFSSKGVVIEQEGTGEISIENICSGSYGNTASIPINNDAVKMVTMKGDQLDTLDMSVVEGKLIDNEWYLLEFSSGIYPEEIWGENKAHWCQSEGKIILKNNSDSTSNVQFKFTTATGSGETGKLVITNGNFLTTCDISGDLTEMCINVSLQPGDNFLDFECSASPLVSATDPREMVFFIMNPTIISHK